MLAASSPRSWRRGEEEDWLVVLWGQKRPLFWGDFSWEVLSLLSNLGEFTCYGCGAACRPLFWEMFLGNSGVSYGKCFLGRCFLEILCFPNIVNLVEKPTKKSLTTQEVSIRTPLKKAYQFVRPHVLTKILEVKQKPKNESSWPKS